MKKSHSNFWYLGDLSSYVLCILFWYFNVPLVNCNRQCFQVLFFLISKKSNWLSIFRSCFLCYKASKLCSWIKKLYQLFRCLPVLPIVFILTNAFHVGVTYPGNGIGRLSLTSTSSPLLTRIPNLIGNYPFLVRVVGVLLYSFNVFKKCKSFWILKNAPKFRDFLHTGQTCALFIWTTWVFLRGISRNTAYTLWKLYSIHLWQVDFITIDFMKLFITF